MSLSKTQTTTAKIHNANTNKQTNKNTPIHTKENQFRNQFDLNWNPVDLHVRFALIRARPCRRHLIIIQ